MRPARPSWARLAELAREHGREVWPLGSWPTGVTIYALDISQAGHVAVALNTNTHQEMWGRRPNASWRLVALDAAGQPTQEPWSLIDSGEVVDVLSITDEGESLGVSLGILGRGTLQDLAAHVEAEIARAALPMGGSLVFTLRVHRMTSVEFLALPEAD